MSDYQEEIDALIREGRWTAIQAPVYRPLYYVEHDDEGEEVLIPFEDWFLNRVLSASPSIDVWEAYRRFFPPKEISLHAASLPMPMLEYLMDDLLQETYVSLYHMAQRENAEEAIDRFIEAGADVNAIDTTIFMGKIGDSIMVLLALARDYVYSLVKWGIYRIPENHVEWDRLRVIEHLMKRGADPLLENRLGVSTVGWLRDARIAQRAEVHRLLKIVERYV